MMDAWAIRHHPCDAPRRSPSLAADENGGAAVPQGHQMGITPNTLQPRVTSALAYVGSVLGLERLDIVQHLVTPANVKARCGKEP